jgi:hypothetical protein
MDAAILRELEDQSVAIVVAFTLGLEQAASICVQPAPDRVNPYQCALRVTISKQDLHCNNGSCRTERVNHSLFAASIALRGELQKFVPFIVEDAIARHIHSEMTDGIATEPNGGLTVIPINLITGVGFLERAPNVIQCHGPLVGYDVAHVVTQ